MNDMKFFGDVGELQDITENINIGQELYTIAAKKDVNLFLEIGTQGGGSARCIGSGLLATSGTLHTVEAIKERVEIAKSNLSGLPVVCHWGVTINSEGLKKYYDHSKDQIPEEENILDKLLGDFSFDAVFLDSCRVSQAYEMHTILQRQKPKYFLMHEPDEKCPGYESFLQSVGYTLAKKGRDKIGNHNPLWVLYVNE